MLQGKGTQYAKATASWMTSFGNMRVVRRRTGTDEDGHAVYEEYRVIQWRGSKTVMAKDRTRCLEPKTVIREGGIANLKALRELLEAGPQQPVPGRVVPNKRSNNQKDNNPMSLVKVGADSEQEGDKEDA